MLTDMGMDNYDKNDPALRNFLYDLKEGRLTPAAKKIMSSVPAREQGIAFIDWLSQNGFTIVLCTDRDLRVAYDITVKWLSDNGVSFDYLFTADSLIDFCENMDSRYLVFGITNDCAGKQERQSINDHGQNGVKLSLFRFSQDKSGGKEENYRVFEFKDFEGVKQCIQKGGC